MVGERVLGLPPEPRLDKGIPFSELRAQGAGGGGMNFALSDEQEFLKEAARGALSRVKTVEAAREALDGGALPDLWPTAVRGRLAGPAGLRGATAAPALAPLEAMLVFEELGRVLASVPLLGHLPATLLLDRGGDAAVVAALAAGAERAALRARAAADRPRRRAGPSSPALGFARAPAPALARRRGDRHGRLGARRARRRPPRRRARRRPRGARRAPPTRVGRAGDRLRRDALARPRARSTARPATLLELDAGGHAPRPGTSPRR